MNCDLCCVYTTNPEQDKYQFLKKQGKKALNPENLPPKKKLDSWQKVIVFNDIKLDNMKKLKWNIFHCPKTKIVIVFI